MFYLYLKSDSRGVIFECKWITNYVKIKQPKPFFTRKENIGRQVLKNVY